VIPSAAVATSHLDQRLTKRDHRVYGALLMQPLVVVEFRPIKLNWVASIAEMHKPDVIKSIRNLCGLGYVVSGPLEDGGNHQRRTYALAVAVALPHRAA
jgi:hypothetical protein